MVLTPTNWEATSVVVKDIEDKQIIQERYPLKDRLTTVQTNVGRRDDEAGGTKDDVLEASSFFVFYLIE